MRFRIVGIAGIFVLAATLPVPAAPPLTTVAPIPASALAQPLLPPNGTVTITVPVHVKGIAKFYSDAYVYCSFRYVGQTPSPNTSVGSGTESGQSKFAPLVDGAFDGNLTVTLKQQTTAPAQINGYWCQFLTTNEGGTPPGIVPKQGTPYTPIVQGSF